MIAGWATVTRHRRAAGYMIASAMMQGALYGYLNSSEQIIAEVFGAQSWFPLVFACVAAGIAIANFSNAAIVERFGARRVSQSAVFAFMATATVQIVVALSGAETLWMFTALMMVNVGLIGFIGSNFGSIAMEDFGHMAGVASSYQSSVSYTHLDVYKRQGNRRGRSVGAALFCGQMGRHRPPTAPMLLHCIAFRRRGAIQNRAGGA